MTRRTLRRLAAVVGLLVAVVGLGGPLPAVTPAAADTRPNFIVIQTDDQRAVDLAYMPNVLKLLAGHGYTFTNSFVTTPLCCPSRTSFLTGRYSSSTGVWDNKAPNGALRWFDDRATIPVWLRRVGYQTSFAGKYLNGYEALPTPFVPPGWTDWHGFRPRTVEAYYDYDLFENGVTTHHGHGPGDYLTDVLADRADTFLRNATAPFFLYFAPYAPHGPAVPAPQDLDAFTGALPQRPLNFNLGVAAGNPANSLPKLDALQIASIDTYAINARASLQAVDRAVAKIVAAVEATGKLDNTIIMFTSDNGMLLGEHKIINKTWAYEPSIRVPLVVRVPWATGPKVDTHLVNNIDLAPTIAELAGVTPGVPPQGTSLLPLLQGKAQTPWRTDMLIEFYGASNGNPMVPPRYRAIRTTTHKLIAYENGAVELYNLVLDPNELLDLADNPLHRNLRTQLLARLEQLRPGFPAAKPPYR